MYKFINQSLNVINNYRFYKSYFYLFTCLSLIFTPFNNEAVVISLEKAKFFKDNKNNCIAFWISSPGEAKGTNLYQAIQIEGNSDWSEPLLISDPEIDAMSYKVSVDGNNNLLVVWEGKNLRLESFILYGKYYSSITDSWSEIEMVSDPSQNLQGNFGINLNTTNMQVVWSVYDDSFDISAYSRFLTIPEGWGPIKELNL